jgi:hypothetical protein
MSPSINASAVSLRRQSALTPTRSTIPSALSHTDTSPHHHTTVITTANQPTYHRTFTSRHHAMYPHGYDNLYYHHHHPLYHRQARNHPNTSTAKRAANHQQHPRHPGQARLPHPPPREPSQALSFIATTPPQMLLPTSQTSHNQACHATTIAHHYIQTRSPSGHPSHTNLFHQPCPPTQVHTLTSPSQRGLHLHPPRQVQLPHSILSFALPNTTTLHQASSTHQRLSVSSTRVLNLLFPRSLALLLAPTLLNLEPCTNLNLNITHPPLPRQLVYPTRPRRHHLDSNASITPRTRLRRLYLDSHAPTRPRRPRPPQVARHHGVSCIRSSMRVSK